MSFLNIIFANEPCSDYMITLYFIKAYKQFFIKLITDFYRIRMIFFSRHDINFEDGGIRRQGYEILFM